MLRQKLSVKQALCVNLCARIFRTKVLRAKANTRANALGVMVSIVLAVTCIIIVLMLFTRNVERSRATCERNEGSCVSAEQCATCSGVVDCELKYPYECQGDSICCPKENIV